MHLVLALAGHRPGSAILGTFYIVCRVVFKTHLIIGWVIYCVVSSIKLPPMMKWITDTIEENDLDSQDDVFEKEPRVQISSQPEQKTQRIDPYEILRQYQAKHGITTWKLFIFNSMI